MSAGIWILIIVIALVLIVGLYLYFGTTTVTTTTTSGGPAGTTGAPPGNDSSGNPYTFMGYSINTSATGFVGIDPTTQSNLKSYLTTGNGAYYSWLTADSKNNQFTWVPALPPLKNS